MESSKEKSYLIILFILCNIVIWTIILYTTVSDLNFVKLGTMQRLISNHTVPIYEVNINSGNWMDSLSKSYDIQHKIDRCFLIMYCISMIAISQFPKLDRRSGHMITGVFISNWLITIFYKAIFIKEAISVNADVRVSLWSNLSVLLTYISLIVLIKMKKLRFKEKKSISLGMMAPIIILGLSGVYLINKLF